jgi:type IV secretory pathway TrbD component
VFEILAPVDPMTTYAPGSGILLVTMMRLAGWQVRIQRGGTRAVAIRGAQRVTATGSSVPEVILGVFQKSVRAGRALRR